MLLTAISEKPPSRTAALCPSGVGTRERGQWRQILQGGEAGTWDLAVLTL